VALVGGGAYPKPGEITFVYIRVSLFINKINPNFIIDILLVEYVLSFLNLKQKKAAGKPAALLK